ncbi:MAG TPA: segregation/condensation protein A [Drouetiella sp.]
MEPKAKKPRVKKSASEFVNTSFGTGTRGVPTFENLLQGTASNVINLDGSAPPVEPQQTGPRYAETDADKAGGIEILIKMATAGEIDAKDIDIIDVTDKFLRAIAAVPKENLRQSGKILFHASVLLRLKAEAMMQAAIADTNSGDDFLDFGEDDGSLTYDAKPEPRQLTLLDLERALVRKANNRQNRQRKVTLDQLIEALREAEKIEKTRKAREPRQRIELAGQHSANDVDDLLDLAHDEDIEDTIARVENILSANIGAGELVHLLRIIQMLGGHGDWVDAFLAVLFLSNAGKLNLEQPEFYGPLFVVRSDAAVQPAEGEVENTVPPVNTSANIADVAM